MVIQLNRTVMSAAEAQLKKVNKGILESVPGVPDLAASYKFFCGPDWDHVQRFVLWHSGLF